MRAKLRRVASLIVICAGTACGAGVGLTPQRSTAVADSVRAAVESYWRFAAEGAMDSLANLYSRASDVRWIEDGKRSDGDAIRREFVSLGALRVETTYDSMRSQSSRRASHPSRHITARGSSACRWRSAARSP